MQRERECLKQCSITHTYRHRLCARTHTHTHTHNTHTHTHTQVRQLWFNQEVNATTTTHVEWDGFDATGAHVLSNPLHRPTPVSRRGDHERGSSSTSSSLCCIVDDASLYEFMWIDTTDVSYEWEGVVGNTGPATGTGAQVSLSPYRAMVIGACVPSARVSLMTSLALAMTPSVISAERHGWQPMSRATL
jgi:hypothetical protein